MEAKEFLKSLKKDQLVIYRSGFGKAQFESWAEVVSAHKSGDSIPIRLTHISHAGTWVVGRYSEGDVISAKAHQLSLSD